MNVGELRRALEGVSDTREVVIFDAAGWNGFYLSASSAETREYLALPDGDFRNPEYDPDSNLPRLHVLVIE